MDIRNDVPTLSYLASALERLGAAEPEGFPALLRASDPSEAAELRSITHRLLANGAADLIEVGRYCERLRTTDPGGAARLEAFVRALMPVRG